LHSAPLTVPYKSSGFSKRRQHRDRQTYEHVFTVGPFFAQYRLGI